MRTVHSVQFEMLCVIPEECDATQDLIDFCRDVEATRNWDGEEFCVQLRPEVGPELWTERALRRSLDGRAHG